MSAGQTLPQIPADDFKPLFREAHIPYRYWDARFIDYGPAGAQVSAYLSAQGQYFNDCDDHRGLVLIGDPGLRNALFPMLARSLVLRRDEVRYIRLSELADYLDTPEDASNTLSKLYEVAALFIDGFYESDLIEARYTGREFRRIEALVRDRIQSNRRVYLSSDLASASMSWYSTSIRNLLTDHTRVMAV